MASLRGNPSNRVAVVLCDGPGGLGAVRALHRHDVPVIAIVFDARESVLASRLPIRTIRCPTGPEGFEANLYRCLQNLDGDRPVLIPTSDRAVAFLSKHAVALGERFDFCIVPDDLVHRLNDKREETELISSLGIPVPKTANTIPACREELADMIGLPMIIKPRSFEHLHRLGRKNLLLRTAADLDAFYASHGDVRECLIAQEVIPGADENLWLCSATFNRRHELIDALVKRKLHTAPPHFGVVSFGVSTSNAKVLELTASVGAKLRYSGHLGMEFKWDARDGRYKYIELNPRLPASVALDEAAGVPTVFNTYRVARGDDVRPVAQRQRDGVIFLDMLNDAYHRRTDGESAATIAWDYLACSLRKRVGPHFAWNDPLPGFYFAANFLRRPIARRLERWRG